MYRVELSAVTEYGFRDIISHDVAEYMNETHKIIEMRLKQKEALGYKNITVLVDGKKYEKPSDTKFVTDVKLAAKHSKLNWIEDRIMGDLDI